MSFSEALVSVAAFAALVACSKTDSPTDTPNFSGDPSAGDHRQEQIFTSDGPTGGLPIGSTWNLQIAAARANSSGSSSSLFEPRLELHVVACGPADHGDSNRRRIAAARDTASAGSEARSWTSGMTEASVADWIKATRIAPDEVARDVRVSPSGQHVAYVVDRPLTGTREVRCQPVDGSPEITLSSKAIDPSSVTSLDWSHDDRLLAVRENFRPLRDAE